MDTAALQHADVRAKSTSGTVLRDKDAGSQARKRLKTDEASSSKEKPDRSCAECRRLKLKCSRQWPCTNCVKRNCSALCPTDTLKKEPIDQTALLQQAGLLFRYVADLEATLEAHGIACPQRSAEMPISVAHLMELCASQGGQGQGSNAPSLSLPKSTAIVDPIYVSDVPYQRSIPEGRANDHRPPFEDSVLDPYNAPDRSASEQSLVAEGSSQPSRGPESSFGPRQTHSKRVRIDERAQRRQSSARSGVGTLIISENGSSKFLGHSAGSEWLGDFGDEKETNRAVSDRRRATEELNQPKVHALALSSIMGAPMTLISSSQCRQLLDSLATQLPPKKEALATMEWYFRHSTWMFLIVRKSNLHSIVDLTYSKMSAVPQEQLSGEASHSDGSGVSGSRSRHRMHLIKGDELALIFSILALGTWFNTTLTVAESSQLSVKWLYASQLALSTSNCVTSPTSVGVQVFHLMALYLLHTQQLKGSDLAWPLLGLCLRMTQAMGLHVDGEAWDLDPEQLNDRRRQFWEIYSHDTFTAIWFGRPGNLYAHEYNCKFPVEEEAQPPSYGDDVDDGLDMPSKDNLPAVGYFTLKFRLARIARRMLSEVFGVRTPCYRDVLAFEAELRRFDEQLPYFMRSRVSDSARIFRSSSSAHSPRTSPEVRPERMRLTIHQHDMASCIFQLRWSLHRKPFAEAILMDPEDPLRTPYAASFVAALESSAQLIAITNSLFQLYPKMSMRSSSFWYHSFSASVLCAFCCFHAPRSEYALVAFTHLDTMCSLLNEARETPRLEQGRRQLMKLRDRAVESLNAAQDFYQNTGATAGTAAGPTRKNAAHTSEDHEAAQAMMGISTRLLRSSEGPVSRSNSEELKGRPLQKGPEGQTRQMAQDGLPAKLASGTVETPSRSDAYGVGHRLHATANQLRDQVHQMQAPLSYFDQTEISQEDLDTFLPMNHTELLNTGPVSKGTPGRPELQPDMEQLLSIEDIWQSLAGSETARADTAGTDSSSTREKNSGTSEASTIGSDLLSSSGGGPDEHGFELRTFGHAGPVGFI